MAIDPLTLTPGAVDAALSRGSSTADFTTFATVTLDSADAGPDATVEFRPSAVDSGVISLDNKNGLPFTLGVPQTLTLNAGVVTPPTPLNGLYLGTNIRHQKIIGTRAAYALWNSSPDFASNQITSTGLQYIVDNAPGAFTGNVDPGIVLKMSWRTCVINKNLKPTQAQARDPNWSNYQWNNADSSIADWLTNQIADANALGIQLGVMLADQATSANNTIPEWVLDEGSAWIENPGVADWERMTHLRQDLPGVMMYYADFVIAFMSKFAPENLWGIIFAEYALGNIATRPAAVQNNRDFFHAQRKILWDTTNRFMPIREDGSQLALYQTNPSLDGAGVDQSDLISNDVGVSQSDVRLFVSNEFIVASEGIMPTVANNDSRYARNDWGQTWPDPVPLNPFGITAGQTVTATPQHIMYNAAYRVPLDSILFTVEAGTVQNKEDVVDAVNKFGPGGTLAGTYGTTPTGGTV